MVMAPKKKPKMVSTGTTQTPVATSEQGTSITPGHVVLDEVTPMIEAWRRDGHGRQRLPPPQYASAPSVTTGSESNTQTQESTSDEDEPTATVFPVLPTMEKFGNQPTESWKQFKTDFERHVRALGGSKKRMAQLLPLYLKDKALADHDSVQDKTIIQDWTRLEETLDKKFRPAARKAGTTLFSRMMKPDESISSYYADLVRIAKEQYEGQPQSVVEQILCNVFINNTTNLSLKRALAKCDAES